MNPRNPKSNKPADQQGDRAEREREGRETSEQGSKEAGRRRDPRFDDRPEPVRRESDREAIQREENEGPAGITTKPSTGESPSRPGSGLPGFGDREPGDPRHLDVEAKQGREKRAPEGGERRPSNER